MGERERVSWGNGSVIVENHFKIFLLHKDIEKWSSNWRELRDKWSFMENITACLYPYENDIIE